MNYSIGGKRNRNDKTGIIIIYQGCIVLKRGAHSSYYHLSPITYIKKFSSNISESSNWTCRTTGLRIRHLVCFSFFEALQTQFRRFSLHMIEDDVLGFLKSGGHWYPRMLSSNFRVMLFSFRDNCFELIYNRHFGLGQSQIV